MKLVPRHRIVIAVEESESSDQAVDWLAGSGLIIDADVLVLHVADRMSDSSNGSMIAESVALKLRPVCTATRVETALKVGSAGAVLLESASGWQSDLIVIGGSRHSGLERLLLGSVGQYVIERAHCPVVIGRVSQVESKNNVLIAVDDSKFSGAALEWVSAQPWARNKNLVILSVLKPLPSSFHSESTARAAEMLLKHTCAESLLSLLVSRWSDMLAADLGRELVPFAISEGNPIDEILKAVVEWPVEMLVIGANGHTSFNERLLGSVSQSIATRAGCAVTVVRGATSGRYDVALSDLEKSSELAEVKAEKPHPAKITGGLAGNNLSAGMGCMY